MNKKLFRDALKQQWYKQGVNGAPLYLNTPAWSGMTMKRQLGFSYTRFFFAYRAGYGEMWYLKSDLARLWRVIKKRSADDPRYLARVKKYYERSFARQRAFFAKCTEPVLRAASDDALLGYAKRMVQAGTDAVGIGHILEPIGLEIENDLKRKLTKEIRDPRVFARAVSLLIAPTQPSFLAKEEMALRRIARLSKDRQEAAILRHARRWSWIRNSYAGSSAIPLSDFKRRLKERIQPWKNPAAAKRAMIRTLGVSVDTRRILDVIDFTTIWQDERKANILTVIEHMDRVVRELSRRTRIPRDVLAYLGTREIAEMRSLSDIAALRDELCTRRHGVFFIMDARGEQAASGSTYRELQSVFSRYHGGEDSHQQEFHGTCAMLGIAVGRVRICKTIASIAQVRKGDILVASMTRPEFMPALRRAAGIVTDEGGITCHAAIVARELGIPAVIGTKIATSALKDGMLVEIRAHHGLVRVL